MSTKRNAFFKHGFTSIKYRYYRAQSMVRYSGYLNKVDLDRFGGNYPQDVVKATIKQMKQ